MKRWSDSTPIIFRFWFHKIHTLAFLLIEYRRLEILIHWVIGKTHKYTFARTRTQNICRLQKESVYHNVYAIQYGFWFHSASGFFLAIEFLFGISFPRRVCDQENDVVTSASPPAVNPISNIEGSHHFFDGSSFLFFLSSGTSRFFSKLRSRFFIWYLMSVHFFKTRFWGFHPSTQTTLILLTTVQYTFCIFLKFSILVKLTLFKIYYHNLSISLVLLNFHHIRYPSAAAAAFVIILSGI